MSWKSSPLSEAENWRGRLLSREPLRFKDGQQTALLLRYMPPGKAVPAFDRTWLALVLTCQVFVGAILGIAAQFVLAVGVIFYVLPWMGLELLETARAVAEFDLPMRVLGLWWGNH